MLDCLILGDSIAVGVGQARPACQTVARTGITSGGWIQSYLPATPISAGNVVISLGVNDDPSMDTAANLRRLRKGVRAGSVTWLLPGLKPDIRRQVGEVARQFGDRVVDTAGEAGPDRLHPSRDGYRTIAAWTEQGGVAPAAGSARVRPVYAFVPQTLPMLAPFRPMAAARSGLAPMGSGLGPVGSGLGPVRSGLGPLGSGLAPLRAETLPGVQVPSVYGAWPPLATNYAAIPPRDLSFRAIPALPRR